MIWPFKPKDKYVAYFPRHHEAFHGASEFSTQERVNLWPLLLTWVSYNIHINYNVWDEIIQPFLNLHRWSLEMDK